MSAAAGLLRDRVVVISGVGPGLGRTLALRCAEQGADVVLAARTRERLEKVAAEVESTGRRALVVPTDITDDESAAALVESAVSEFGGVDVLVNNAFSVPSMKLLARTDFQQIRDSVELTVLGALRLTQLFTPALAESAGAVVNINSMVLRHSQERYGSYKLAKSALLAMSQSLATELGPQGIRVNSVAPGYIWGTLLQGYFEHQAGKYGTTVEQIYEHTAAASDLKRLPTTEEIADAVIFLASSMASAITGQCLDVNCGEYHH
ncbi:MULTISPECIES: SDR family oxidoreductase [Rhodococcus]|uniref:SDR family oxidoreductase n=1 Tax=Rhodococcus TaxID=1827 RepID=UPI001E42A690|nr:SDR family oxidoreductase [Rhodococcus pyridinivorans]MCD2117700.1 SDR family oxidoreductase [Rhodococcus pyridinivorans]MCZ4626678.1 SDR family oxidoreductase [Rhodococcus pyridinivorans]MCZ4647781.1 SDR family oxidoreductase [Rhodococcus pyridinivorans]MDJ0482892.1 SDR family oxidoreductase [Rhodococcus pyridinivorans]MDV7253988.1 SDR family oxidoreductase [Rhodococcus pyridinivorans]